MNKLEEIKRVANEAECLHSRTDLAVALDRIAQEITERLQDTNPILLCVLNGGIIPTGELATRLHFPLEMDSIKASRYQGATQGSTVEWSLKPTLSLQDRTVLIVDDVLDEGITLAEIRRYCEEQGARDVYAAVIVEKKLNKSKPAQAEFIAVQADDRYLFGYGMDYKSYLRNWPGIYACTTVY
ncbi:MAG: hypoxanthine-guanine phosphoribosyltransferase [Methylococcaceae bacterium]